MAAQLCIKIKMIFLFIIFSSFAVSRQLLDRFKSLSSSNQLRKYHSLIQKSDFSINGNIMSNLLVKRVSGSEGNLKVQHFIKEFFSKLGWHIEEDKFTDNTPHGQIAFNNIIVTKDTNAHHKLVLAAHFDSKYFKDFDFIGATDSAAPCGILMNLAQTLNPLLERRSETLDTFTTIQLIFFDGEEAFKDWTATDSIYGARHLAEKWSDTMVTLHDLDMKTSYSVSPLQQIVAFVLLDLLGTKTATIMNSHPETQWVWDRLSKIHERLGVLKLLSPFMLDRLKKRDPMFIPGAPRISALAIADDHVPFYNLGVPITHCIAAPFPIEWHTEADNADALDEGTLYDLSLAFTVLVGEYLGLNDFLEFI